MRTFSSHPGFAIFVSLVLCGLGLVVFLTFPLEIDRSGSPRSADTSSSDQVPLPSEEGEDSETPPSDRRWPIYITSMTHLEGEWTAAATESRFFEGQAKKIRHGMDIAEEYGAILTIESEKPMAQGMANFDDNILQEALDRGHGVGTHCDISARTPFSDTEIVQEFTERKVLVDALVGKENNFGCSGGGGLGDWYVGATGAGFSYINGIVGFHYLALPVSERPDGWDNQRITREYFHYIAPQNADTYFYPFLISEVGFTEDPAGDLLVSAGSLGNIRSFAEVAPWTLMADTHCPDGSCPFTSEDAQGVVAFIEDFAETFDGSRPAKIVVYFPTDLFSGGDDAVLRELLGGIQELVETGDVVWTSQRGVYDGVMEYYDVTY